MRRPRTGLARLLACLLLLQWAGAVLPQARAMARMATAQAVELCTHEGKRRVLLDESGAPVKPAEDAGCCTPGQAPAAVPPEPPGLAHPIRYALFAGPYGRPGLPAIPPRAPPQQPRAPPNR